jgi:hypothetical protein
MTGTWPHSPAGGGRGFALVHLAKDRHGRFSGSIRRPGHFDLRSDFAVDGVAPPMIVQPLEYVPPERHGGLSRR